MHYSIHILSLLFCYTASASPGFPSAGHVKRSPTARQVVVQNHHQSISFADNNEMLKTPEQKTTPEQTPATPVGTPAKTEPKHDMKCDNKMCPTGTCCSKYNWCGIQDAYCGDGCKHGPCKKPATAPPTQATPPSSPVVQIPAPPQPIAPVQQPTRTGPLPYGKIFNSCHAPNTVALVFVGAPSELTAALLDLLKHEMVKATFFIRHDPQTQHRTSVHPLAISRIHNEGHQIGLWSEKKMDEISEEAFITERRKFNQMLQPFIGDLKPTYVFPKEQSCNDVCKRTLHKQGMHIIVASLQTKDQNIKCEGTLRESENIITRAYEKGGNIDYISVAHDDQEYKYTIRMIEHQINLGKELKFSHTTVGECLGDPKENWYQKTN